MITVRFPSGLVVQYNGAAFVQPGSVFHRLWDSEDKRVWYADVLHSSGAIIEARPPCRVFSTADGEDAVSAIAEAAERRQLAPASQVARLKKALRRFDAKRWRWNP